jgi:uncharacterized membrane protein YfcA
VVGFLKTSIAGGVGLLLTPTLSLLLPAPVVLALIAPLMNLSDPLALRLYWRRWDARQLRLLAPSACVGVAVGAWGLSRLSEPGLRRTIGLVALALALAQLALRGEGRPLFGERPHWAVGAVAGVITGLASVVAHSGGLVVGLYLLGTGLSTAGVVATATALYALTNAVKLIGYWQIGFLGWPVLAADLLVLPLLLVGAWLGYRVNRVLPRRAFELALIAIALAGAARLLLGS